MAVTERRLDVGSKRKTADEAYRKQRTQRLADNFHSFAGRLSLKSPASVLSARLPQFVLGE